MRFVPEVLSGRRDTSHHPFFRSPGTRNTQAALGQIVYKPRHLTRTGVDIDDISLHHEHDMHSPHPHSHVVQDFGTGSGVGTPLAVHDTIEDRLWSDAVALALH